MPAEKTKPFTLVKYFSYTSLTLMFLGTVTLSYLNTHLARSMQREKSEEYALLLVENLNHQVFLQFIIPVALRFGKIQLRNKEQYERMDKVVRSTLHSFNVEMVNIYDMKHTISYSFNMDKIGKQNLGGTGYQTAVAGTTTSKLVQQGNFWEILLGIPIKSELITFAPLRAETPLEPVTGPVLGVVEIVQDLSDDYRSIFKFQVLVIVSSTVVMGILFLVLIAVVRRGENIIHKRTLERMALKEKLFRAERLSSLGEMVAGISHEIRNPLGIITSSAELLKKKMLKIDPSNSIPNIIMEESNRLNNIITDFLNYARPRQPNLVPCRIDEILNKNIAFLSSNMEGGGYQINRNYSNMIPEIHADVEMLYQAFLNILINAMQAMPDGGIIHVGVSASDIDIAIFFEDEGDGIDPELDGKVWAPFFTTKETGTGLGLGIVKNIIEAHGGGIRIENRNTIGARVTIDLPLLVDE